MEEQADNIGVTHPVPAISASFIQRLVITIQSCGEVEKDMRRIKHLHGYLSSHPGEVRFSFCISEAEKTYEIDFPNDSTELSESLMNELSRFVGGDQYRILQDRP